MEIIEEYFDGISELYYWDPETGKQVCFHVERESERSRIFDMGDCSFFMMAQIKTNNGYRMVCQCGDTLNYFRHKYSIAKVKKILNLIGG